MKLLQYETLQLQKVSYSYIDKAIFVVILTLEHTIAVKLLQYETLQLQKVSYS